MWTPAGFVDVANPTERIAIEVDGPEHSQPKNRKRDREKERDLRRLGYDVYRVCEFKCRALPARRLRHALRTRDEA
jgi:very-short-patch-repair endonuclease